MSREEYQALMDRTKNVREELAHEGTGDDRAAELGGELKELKSEKDDLHAKAWEEAIAENANREAATMREAAEVAMTEEAGKQARAEELAAEIKSGKNPDAVPEMTSVEAGSSQAETESSFITEMPVAEQKIQDEQIISKEELYFSDYEQGVVSDIRNMVKSDDFSGVFKRILKERKRADQYQEVSSGQTGFFKKLMAPKGDAICDMEKLGGETRSLLEEKLKTIVGKDDLNAYKRYVSAAKNNEAVFDTDLPGGLFLGVTNFESVGPKIQEFNLDRAKREISSFNQNSSVVPLEEFVSGRASLLGNNDPQFREALLKAPEVRKQFLKLARIITSPDSSSANGGSYLQELVSDGYLTKTDIENL